MTTIKASLEAVFSVGAAPRLYNEDISQDAVTCQFSWVKRREVADDWEQLSVESQPVKRRLGGWGEMATSLEPS
jgi:hypothetical protein